MNTIRLRYPFTKKYNSGIRYIDERGDIYIRLRPIGENNHSVRLKYTRYIAAVYLKRFLTSNEKVYQINKQQTDFSIQNLKITTSSNIIDKNESKLMNFKRRTPILKPNN